MTLTEQLNLWGIVLQLLGFIILAADLWPAYCKAKRLQIMVYTKNFFDHLNSLFEKGDKKRVYWFYVSKKESWLDCLGEIQKHWKEIPMRNPDDLIKEELFKNIFETFSSNYQRWTDSISNKETFRNMYVGEAIIFVVIGYLLQLIGTLIDSKLLVF